MFLESFLDFKNFKLDRLMKKIVENLTHFPTYIKDIQGLNAYNVLKKFKRNDEKDIKDLEHLRKRMMCSSI